MQGDRVEALRLLGNVGLGPVEANGGGWVSRGLGICDFVSEHDATLDGLGQHGLTGLGMLIPAEGLARQEGVAEPLEGDEGVSAALGFGEGATQFLDAGVLVSVATDDPAMFGLSMAGELAALQSTLAFSDDEIRQLLLNAVESCWLPAPRRIALRAAHLADPAWAG